VLTNQPLLAQKENITASELNALNTVESSNNVPKAKPAVAVPTTTQNTTKQTEKRTETTAPVKKVEEFPTM
jgi:LysM repeat protein